MSYLSNTKKENYDLLINLALKSRSNVHAKLSHTMGVYKEVKVDILHFMSFFINTPYRAGH